MNRINYKHGDLINGVRYLREAEPHIRPSGTKERQAVFECPYCGNEFTARIGHVKSGNTRSCGCYKKKRASETHTKHGLHGTPLHWIWKDIKQRCYNPNHHAYHRYGGRGIKMCDEWRDDFRKFYNWSLSHGYQEGLEIDRIDNDGDYCPENCRWVTRAENNRNKSTTKLTKEQAGEIRKLALEGELTQKEIGEIYGVSDGTVSKIKLGKLWN